MWGERICTSREPERNSKGKPESQARSDRSINTLNEGWLGCTPEGARVVAPREGSELRLLSLCPFTRARTVLPSAVQSLEHGAIGPSRDPAYPVTRLLLTLWSKTAKEGLDLGSSQNGI